MTDYEFEFDDDEDEMPPLFVDKTAASAQPKPASEMQVVTSRFEMSTYSSTCFRRWEIIIQPS